MKRAALLLVALVLAVATPVLGQEIVLEMWDGITDSDTEGIDALVAQFNEEYKGRIRVDRTATPWEELDDKVAVSVLAGTPPDIWIMHRENVPAHAMRNLLLPMDQYFEMAGLSDDDFLPGLADGGVYEGRRYGVPLD
jgi:multiple sugar transport system substrate-binding protein